MAPAHMSGTTTYDSDPSVPMAGTAFWRAEGPETESNNVSSSNTRAVQHTALIGAHSGRLPGALARLVEDMVSLNQGIAVGISRGDQRHGLDFRNPARRFGLSITTIPPGVSYDSAVETNALWTARETSNMFFKST
jgi:hypothetical protein